LVFGQSRWRRAPATAQGASKPRFLASFLFRIPGMASALSASLGIVDGGVTMPRDEIAETTPVQRRDVMMKRHLCLLTLTLVGALGATALLYAQETNKGKDLPKSEKLEPYKCGKVERLHTFGGIFLASQPTPEDFKLAKEGGIKTVINLREKEEIEWDEEALVKKLGMEYYHLPFKSPAGLTDEVFAKARQILTNKDRQPILLHCSSANRVGAIWLAHRALDHGLSYDKALEEAKTVGLKLPGFVDKAKDYVARNTKQ
jgi:uncharacterized protein (TIGR01244 family)